MIQEEALIYQTDKEFAKYPNIRHYGCFFLTITKKMSELFKLPFTHTSVLNFYERELADADIDVDNEMFVGSAQNLITDLLGSMKVLYRGHKSVEYELKKNEVAWGCWHRTNTNFNHFTDGIVKGELYDPWSAEGSESVRSGQLISIRVAQIL